MATLNDVMDYSKFYFGKDVPPVFYYEKFELENKLFVPADDFKLCEKLNYDSKKDVILHYFVKDSSQNRLIINNLADRKLHSKVYAVASPDFSADSNNCYSCFNESNILKSRICAYRWQSELGERVLLTWQWAGKDTYKWSFGNVDKGTPGVVSSQSVKDWNVFESGFRAGIDMIAPEFLCWLGEIPSFVSKCYDLNRIIKMNTRTSLLHDLKQKNCNVDQGEFLFNEGA